MTTHLSDQQLDCINNVFEATESIIDVVIVAAGIGSRMKADRPKQYLLLDDKTILEHTVLNVLNSPRVNKIILVLNEHDAYFNTTIIPSLSRIVTVNGGAQRVDSSLAGVYKATTEWVMVHDAARPFITVQAIDELLYQVAYAVQEQKAVGGILASPIADTIKKSDEHNCIAQTVDRSFMYGAQTPQLFRKNELIEAIQYALKSNINITDEASALENMGKNVVLVKNSNRNFKITTQDDLLLARALIQSF